LAAELMILAAAAVFMVLLPEDDERDDFDILDSIRIFTEKGNSFSVTKNDDSGQKWPFDFPERCSRIGSHVNTRWSAPNLIDAVPAGGTSIYVLVLFVTFGHS
jgi:hypothetical protein